MKLLIINADDFGMAAGVTNAIVDCHNNGIVTSTTLMTNMPDAERAADLSRPLKALGVGVHLNLTEGRPLTDSALLPDLVDESGEFFPHETLARAGSSEAGVDRVSCPDKESAGFGH